MAKSAKQGQMAGSRKNQLAANSNTSAIELLKQDHRKVEKLFEEFENSDDDDHKQGLVEQICTELNIHTLLEEEIFYPHCRDAGVEDDKMDESQVEHDTAKIFVNDLLHSHGSSQYWEAKVKALKELVQHHVQEEERPGQGVFAQAKSHNVDSPNLAGQMMRRKQELQQRNAGERPARLVSIEIELQGGMSRQWDMEHDERGRFTGQDEDYRRYAGGPTYRDEDRRYGRSGSYGEREGRRSAYEDDYRGSGRSQGGWYGDSRGQGDASRRGWEERRGGHNEDDDYGRRPSRTRDEDHGGWYGDERGHAEAARRGWQHRR
jgi:hemerythrin superfamily protein